MSQSHFTKILVVLTALLVCASMMQAQVSPLTASPTTVSLTFQKGTGQGSGPGADVPVGIAAASSTPFTIDATTVPWWLTLSAMSGTADSQGSASITFNAPPSGTLIGAGSYSTIVKFDVVVTSQSGVPTLTVMSVPVSLIVTDVTPTLTVTGGSGLTFTWRQGTALPTPSLFVLSSDEPLAFTVVAAVTSPTNPANWIQIAHASGVAYSWGTPVAVSFNPLLSYTTNVGDTLTGTVTITPAVGNALTPINVAITVGPPVAAITSLWPPSIPLQTTNSNTDKYNITVTGSGFVSPTMKAVTVTQVGGLAAALPTADVTVSSSTTMVLAIPSKVNLETAGQVVITVANASDTPSPAPVPLNVTTAPIIYAVTSSASYLQESQGATPNIAPYDLISIFGDNFLGAGGSGVVNATPDATFFNFPATLTSSGNPIVVNFYKADGSTLIAAAPLLFASQQQINIVVPAEVAGNAKVYIAVSYTIVASSQYAANVVTADPGIFTTNADGLGQAAILNSDYTANSSSVEAKAGNTVMIYMAGLGAPTSTGTDTVQTSQAFPKSCISTAAYMGAVNGQQTPPSPLWASIDGAVIHSAWLATKTFPPCFATSPTVTIGGKAATVTYAGFVADSVGGLYQINATVPATVTPGTAVPVVVTVGAATSQPGVTMAVVATGGH